MCIERTPTLDPVNFTVTLILQCSLWVRINNNSETSDKGPSKKRKTSLERTVDNLSIVAGPKVKEDNLSIVAGHKVDVPL